MERAAFLIEDTNQRLECLLNPESLVVRRVAGVRSRASLGGKLTGARLAEDPLLYTGGGRTELELDLLFDVNLAGSTPASEDVRALTAPIWNLAENAAGVESRDRPPLVRLVWGKSWNSPGIVAAVAERLEDFSASGAPQRSWLRMRLLRVNEPSARVSPTVDPTASLAPTLEAWRSDPEAAAGNTPVHEVSGDERLDEVAYQHYGDPALWRLIAEINDIADPTDLAPGSPLLIP